MLISAPCSSTTSSQCGSVSRSCWSTCGRFPVTGRRGCRQAHVSVHVSARVGCVAYPAAVACQLSVVERDGFYLKFVSLLVNDSIFLLDDSLEKIPRLREREREAESGQVHGPGGAAAQEEDQERRGREEQFQRDESVSASACLPACLQETSRKVLTDPAACRQCAGPCSWPTPTCGCWSTPRWKSWIPSSRPKWYAPPPHLPGSFPPRV